MPFRPCAVSPQAARDRTSSKVSRQSIVFFISDPPQPVMDLSIAVLSPMLVNPKVSLHVYYARSFFALSLCVACKKTVCPGEYVLYFVAIDGFEHPDLHHLSRVSLPKNNPPAHGGVGGQGAGWGHGRTSACRDPATSKKVGVIFQKAQSSQWSSGSSQSSGSFQSS